MIETYGRGEEPPDGSQSRQIPFTPAAKKTLELSPAGSTQTTP